MSLAACRADGASPVGISVICSVFHGRFMQCAPRQQAGRIEDEGQLQQIISKEHHIRALTRNICARSHRDADMRFDQRGQHKSAVSSVMKPCSKRPSMVMSKFRHPNGPAAPTIS
jgi:hypothetical protein